MRRAGVCAGLLLVASILFDRSAGRALADPWDGGERGSLPVLVIVGELPASAEARDRLALGVRLFVLSSRGPVRVVRVWAMGDAATPEGRADALAACRGRGSLACEGPTTVGASFGRIWDFDTLFLPNAADAALAATMDPRAGIASLEHLREALTARRGEPLVNELGLATSRAIAIGDFGVAPTPTTTSPRIHIGEPPRGPLPSGVFDASTLDAILPAIESALEAPSRCVRYTGSLDTLGFVLRPPLPTTWLVAVSSATTPPKPLAFAQERFATASWSVASAKEVVEQRLEDAYLHASICESMPPRYSIRVGEPRAITVDGGPQRIAAGFVEDLGTTFELPISIDQMEEWRDALDREEAEIRVALDGEEITLSSTRLGLHAVPAGIHRLEVVVRGRKPWHRSGEALERISMPRALRVDLLAGESACTEWGSGTRLVATPLSFLPAAHGLVKDSPQTVCFWSSAGSLVDGSSEGTILVAERGEARTYLRYRVKARVWPVLLAPALVALGLLALVASRRRRAGASYRLWRLERPEHAAFRESAAPRWVGVAEPSAGASESIERGGEDGEGFGVTFVEEGARLTTTTSRGRALVRGEAYVLAQEAVILPGTTVLLPNAILHLAHREATPAELPPPPSDADLRAMGEATAAYPALDRKRSRWRLLLVLLSIWVFAHLVAVAVAPLFEGARGPFGYMAIVVAIGVAAIALLRGHTLVA